MKIQINGEWRVIPSMLREVTLKQRIDFQEQHGNLLDAMLKSVMEIEDEEERELELAEYQFVKMFKTLSFFLNCTEESLKETEFLDTISRVYFASIASIFEEEQEIAKEGKYKFEWNNEEWYLHSPELKNGDKMTFGELIDSKQIIQDMARLGKNRWECLLPLCAVYLRRKDELYEEHFLYADSNRLSLMETLPLDIALQVGFFLSSSLSILTRLFQSSSLQESREQVGI